MKLADIHAFGADFDLDVSRENGKLRVNVTQGGKTIHTQTIAEGESFSVKFAE